MTKDEMRRKHEERMRLAAEEMEAQALGGDPSAGPQIFRADVGYGTFSHSEVPTTSPKILYHDKPYEQIRNAHPQLESGEVEELLAHCLGQSVYQAAPSFEGFDREKLAQVLAMSVEEVEDLLYEDDNEQEK